jgi:hypothetical protein
MTVELTRTDDRPAGRLSFNEVKSAWHRVARLNLDWRERPVQRGTVDYGFRSSRHPNQSQVVDFSVQTLSYGPVGRGRYLYAKAIVGEGYVVSVWPEFPEAQGVFADMIGKDLPPIHGAPSVA